MDLGGTGRQRIVLNENTMWSGGPYDANRPDAHKCLPEVRERFFARDFDGAGKALANFRYADRVKGWFDHDQFGCYQILADLTLDFGGIEITSPAVTAKAMARPSTTAPMAIPPANGVSPTCPQRARRLPGNSNSPRWETPRTTRSPVPKTCPTAIPPDMDSRRLSRWRHMDRTRPPA